MARILFEKKYVVKGLLCSKEKLLLPNKLELVKYYPEELREDFEHIADILEQQDVYTYERIALIEQGNNKVETWVKALEYLLDEWGIKIVIPLFPFLEHTLNEFTYDLFFKDVRQHLLAKGRTENEVDSIEVYVDF